MNEITRIHLGHQPYTISVEAHKDLKAYLDAIQKNVADEEVANEVELRMSELLTERGLTSDKVILAADVDYLKKQLGNPADFSDDSEAPRKSTIDEKTTKRLFRDPTKAYVAGVAAGLASYTGLDATLIRLIFVLLTIFGGGIGILLYVLLWLVVPPAETASERLQMQGKPVTLEALKASVEKADVAGTARRVNQMVLPVINGIFRLCLKLIGVGFILAGAAMFIGVATTKMYMQLHNGRLFQENLFPVGVREQWLVGLGMLLIVLAGLFLALMGIATFKRKWPIRGWITGVLAGIFVLSSIAGCALAADAAPRVQQRYQAIMHTTAVKNIKPFNKVTTEGNIDLTYISSPNYAVNIHYADHPDVSKLKVYVSDNTLHVDARQLPENHCTMLCLYPRYNMTVQIYAPNIEKFATPPRTEIFYP